MESLREHGLQTVTEISKVSEQNVFILFILIICKDVPHCKRLQYNYHEAVAHKPEIHFKWHDFYRQW